MRYLDAERAFQSRPQIFTDRLTAYGPGLANNHYSHETSYLVGIPATSKLILPGCYVENACFPGIDVHNLNYSKRPSCVVIPAKAGIQERSGRVDSRFRGNDILCYVIVIEGITVVFDSKTVSLSKSYKQRLLGDFCIVASSEIILLLIKFKVAGNLRFLSHAETLSFFQRACVRAGISIQYSQGFNPRPKLSLPLPRSVGVESDDELLCLRVAVDPDELRVTSHESRIKAELSAQVPEGCELISVSTARTGRSFQPCSATYMLVVKPEYLNDKLKATITSLLASENLNIQRRTGIKQSKVKNLDVRVFLKSIKMDDRGIIVQCNISSAGSIRIEEILKLLELDEDKLALPIRRTNVQWQADEL